MTLTASPPSRESATLESTGFPRRLLLVGAAAAVMLLATTACLGVIAKRHGVYVSETRVLFLAPPSAQTPNALVSPSDSLITTAGVVAKMVGASFDSPPVVSDTVTLPGEGVRYGWSAHLPNIGGQWAANFAEPAVVVQAVAGDPGTAQAMASDVVGRVRSALTQLEDASQVLPVNRISLVLNPDVPVVRYVAGSSKRAMASCLMLGAASTWLVAAFVWRRTRPFEPAHAHRAQQSTLA